MKEEFYGKLVGFPFNAGIHQEGVVVKCMGSGSVGMEEGVAQFVGADEGPEGFVDVAVDMNEWGAVEAGEIAVHAAQVFKEDLVLQGAGNAEGVPCLVTDY